MLDTGCWIERTSGSVKIQGSRFRVLTVNREPGTLNHYRESSIQDLVYTEVR